MKKCTCETKKETDGRAIYTLMKPDENCPIHGKQNKVAPEEQVEFFGESFQKETKEQIYREGKAHVPDFLSAEYRRRFIEFNNTKIMQCWKCIDAIEYLAHKHGLIWDKDLQCYVYEDD